MSSMEIVQVPRISERLAQPGWRRWMTRPLCRRYTLLLAFSFSLKMQGEGTEDGQLWRWMLGKLADDEREPLGAWPATDSHDRFLRKHLWDRGVVDIGALLGDESLAHTMEVPVAALPLSDSGLAAMASVAQLRANIERAVSRGSPFADIGSAEACIALVFEKAEFAEIARHRRDARDHRGSRRLAVPAMTAEASRD